ncbi:hypothetical protein QBC39DRAFT_150760 [Podospora conica]|nr:hypothetical protein QBC39DRAFT_150760 [Schizothecium conicum]
MPNIVSALLCVILTVCSALLPRRCWADGMAVQSLFCFWKRVRQSTVRFFTHHSRPARGSSWMLLPISGNKKLEVVSFFRQRRRTLPVRRQTPRGSPPRRI